MSDELRLSVSKTKCFENCKKQFKFSYILKFPKKEHDYHIFGKFCHKILEDFHNTYINGSILPFNIVMNKAFKDAVIEYTTMTSEMKKDCWKLIDQYLKIISNDKKNNLSANVIACEKEFKLLIDDKFILNGMIDRIQIDADDVLHVCDYKTTKNKKYLKEDWFQLLTYAFILVSEDPSIKKVRGSYILLRHDFEYITKEFDIDEIMSIKDKYLTYAKNIKEEKDFLANPNFLCGWCDFLEHCTEGMNKVKPSLIYGEVSY